MPSHLRYQINSEPVDAVASYQHTSPSPPPAKKAKTAKMSLTQTYYVASAARSKLGREAARPDHNLRRLVGHANMLDQLMAELSHAETEQEAWFNSSVRSAAAAPQPQRVHFVDTIVEEVEEQDEATDDDDDDEEESDDEFDTAAVFSTPLRRIRSPPLHFSAPSFDDMDAEYDDDEDDDSDDDDDDVDDPEFASFDFATAHAQTTSPPELTYDDSDSEEEMPASPHAPAIALFDPKALAAAEHHHSPAIAAF